VSIGRIILPALAWAPLDGSSGNAPAELDFLQSDAANDPTPRFARWAFADNADEHICVTFTMPGDYGGSPRLKLQWYINDTSDDVRWRGKLMAVTPNNDETVEDKTYTVSVTVLGTASASTARALLESELDFSSYNDSLAAGDLALLILWRDGDDADDDASGDACFISGLLEYTRA